MGLLFRTYETFEKVVKRLLGLLEFFLFLRFLLKFLNASPRAIVVNFIFKYSDIIISPFNFIFPNILWRNYLIEFTTIAAMIGYFILVFFIFRILRLFSQE
jgi:hypothetical protein